MMCGSKMVGDEERVGIGTVLGTVMIYAEELLP